MQPLFKKLIIVILQRLLQASLLLLFTHSVLAIKLPDVLQHSFQICNKEVIEPDCDQHEFWNAWGWGVLTAIVEAGLDDEFTAAISAVAPSYFQGNADEGEVAGEGIVDLLNFYLNKIARNKGVPQAKYLMSQLACLLKKTILLIKRRGDQLEIISFYEDGTAYHVLEVDIQKVQFDEMQQTFIVNHLNDADLVFFVEELDDELIVAPVAPVANVQEQFVQEQFLQEQLPVDPLREAIALHPEGSPALMPVVIGNKDPFEEKRIRLEQELKGLIEAHKQEAIFNLQDAHLQEQQRAEVSTTGLKVLSLIWNPVVVGVLGVTLYFLWQYYQWQMGKGAKKPWQ